MHISSSGMKPSSWTACLCRIYSSSSFLENLTFRTRHCASPTQLPHHLIWNYLASQISLWCQPPPPNPRDADHSLSIRVSRLIRAPDGFRRRGLSRRERQKAALGPPADVCVRGVLFHRSRRRYVWRNIAVFLWSCGTWSPSLRMFHCFI